MTTLLIDGTQQFIRCFAAYSNTNADGQNFGAVVWFLRTLNTIVHDNQPSRVVIVFDGPGGSKRRRAISAQYKNGRRPKKYNRIIELNEIEESNSKAFQFQRLEHYLSDLPVNIVSIEDIEADDTIAFLCNWFSGQKVIASSDQDFLQLASHSVKLYNPVKRKFVSAEDCQREHSIAPKNMALARAIAGDRSDNLKGVPGIGLKKLSKLVPEFNEPFLSSDKLFTIAKERAINKITDNKELIEQNHKLMTLSSAMISSQSITRIKRSLEVTPQYHKTQIMLKLMRDGIEINPSFFQNFLKLSYAARKQKE